MIEVGMSEDTNKRTLLFETYIRKGDPSYGMGKVVMWKQEDGVGHLHFNYVVPFCKKNYIAVALDMELLEDLLTRELGVYRLVASYPGIDGPEVMKWAKFCSSLGLEYAGFTSGGVSICRKEL